MKVRRVICVGCGRPFHPEKTFPVATTAGNTDGACMKACWNACSKECSVNPDDVFSKWLEDMLPVQLTAIVDPKTGKMVVEDGGYPGLLHHVYSMGYSEGLKRARHFAELLGRV